MSQGQFLGTGKAIVKGLRFSRNVCKDSAYVNELQNRRLREIVTKAYEETDFYRKKYDQAGITPDAIQTVEDLPKLPLINKADLIENFDSITPESLDRKRALSMGTSGSTGRPLQVYKDQKWMAHVYGFGFHMRRFHKMGIPRVGFVIDVGSEESLEAQIVNQSKWFTKYFAPNTVILHVEHDMAEIMERLEKANVHYICTYTGVMRELAHLRNNGLGKKLKLKKIGLTGEILDDYTRQYIEEAFGCPCYSAYLSTKAGPIAIECINKKMHVYSDSCIVEVVNEDGQPASRGSDGSLVLTCPIEGNSTPIIRYIGCADVGQILKEECTCGMNTPIIGPIKGRTTDSIRLPSGKVYHAFSMTIPMEKIQRKHGRDRIRQYQIVQHDIDSISISIVRNKDKTNPGDTLSDIKKVIEDNYQEQLGEGMHLTVNEVLELPKTSNLGMPTPLVVSKIGERVQGQ